MPRRNPRDSRAARRALAAKLSAQVGPAERRYVRALRGVSQSWASAYVKAAAPFLDTIARGDGGDGVLRLDMTTLPHAWDVLGIQVQVAIPRTVGPLFDRMSAEVQRANARGMALIGIRPHDTGVQAKIAEARDANIKLVE